MKNKHIVALLVSGVLIVLVASLFKIMHWPGAAKLLIFGFAIEVLGGLLMMIKILKTKNFKDFMNQ